MKHDFKIIKRIKKSKLFEFECKICGLKATHYTAKQANEYFPECPS